MTDKSATLLSLLHGMLHAVETTDPFACERKMFEYIDLGHPKSGASVARLR